MELTAIDVGQGDSLLVVSPERQAMLVDAGGPVGVAAEAVSSRWEMGEDVVSPYLWSRGVRRLDVVALTHAHSDHMGGMPAVLRNFRPKEMWVSVASRSVAFEALQREAEELGVKLRWLRAGDAFGWGGARVRVLGPERGYVNSGAPVNDDSLVLEVSYGNASMLLEGDAEAASEAAMVRSGRLKPETVLKVGHHGSRTSSNEEFLRAVQPKAAVISVGRGNRFGHPREEVLGRLQAMGVQSYATDLHGLTTFRLESGGRISEMRSTSNP